MQKWFNSQKIRHFQRNKKKKWSTFLKCYKLLEQYMIFLNFDVFGRKIENIYGFKHKKPGSIELFDISPGIEYV